MSTRERVTFPGVLTGQGHTATCTIEADLVTLPGSNAGAYTGYRVEPGSVSEVLPEGIYALFVNGERHQVRYADGQWIAA